MDFDYQLHVFKYPDLESIVAKAIDFFKKTPVHPLPPPHRFSGTGVYGLYYIGDFDLYAPIANQNRIEYTIPIYIGKAVPPGRRTSRSLNNVSANLLGRLREHENSIKRANNLETQDFRCRFMVLDGVESDLIEAVEARLIRHHSPLWNACISGFGIHVPGSGRTGQQPSEWDTFHPGRAWGGTLTGKQRNIEELRNRVKQFLASSEAPPEQGSLFS
jgi:hypothetical protein